MKKLEPPQAEHTDTIDQRQLTTEELSRQMSHLNEFVSDLRTQRTYIEAVTKRAQACIGVANVSLVLVSTVVNANDNELLDWSVLRLDHPDFAEVVTNRIRRGYIALGLLWQVPEKPPDLGPGHSDAPGLSAFNSLLPQQYHDDFVAFAQEETNVIAATLWGVMPTEYSVILGPADPDAYPPPGAA
jgi:hypothetical protein